MMEFMLLLKDDLFVILSGVDDFVLVVLVLME